MTDHLAELRLSDQQAEPIQRSIRWPGLTDVNPSAARSLAVAVFFSRAMRARSGMALANQAPGLLFDHRPAELLYGSLLFDLVLFLQATLSFFLLSSWRKKSPSAITGVESR